MCACMRVCAAYITLWVCYFVSLCLHVHVCVCVCVFVRARVCVCVCVACDVTITPLFHCEHVVNISRAAIQLNVLTHSAEFNITVGKLDAL